MKHKLPVFFNGNSIKSSCMQIWDDVEKNWSRNTTTMVHKVVKNIRNDYELCNYNYFLILKLLLKFDVNTVFILGRLCVFLFLNKIKVIFITWSLWSATPPPTNVVIGRQPRDPNHTWLDAGATWRTLLYNTCWRSRKESLLQKSEGSWCISLTAAGRTSSLQRIPELFYNSASEDDFTVFWESWFIFSATQDKHFVMRTT